MSEDTAGSTPKTEPKTEKTDQKTEAPGRSPYHLAMGFAAIAAVFVTAMTAAGFTIPKLFQPPEEQRWHSMGYTDDFPPPKANLSPGTATPDETFLQSL